MAAGDAQRSLLTGWVKRGDQGGLPGGGGGSWVLKDEEDMGSWAEGSHEKRP